MTGLLDTLTKLAPVALVFAAGVVFVRRKIIDADMSKAFSEFAFRFAIPAYLLTSLYTADLHRVFSPRALSAYTLIAVSAAALVAAIARARGARARETALRVMAACQVNTAYVAIPVFTMLWADVSPIFPVILLQVSVLTTVVIAIMESAPTGLAPASTSVAFGVRRGLWAALTTPVVLACWTGIAANVSKVPVPHWALDALSMAGAAASPVALFALGLHLGSAGLRWRGATFDEYWLVGFKCFGFPILAWAIAHFLFHLSGLWLAHLVVLAAMPAPLNLFILAQTYDVDVDLAASAVVKTTLVSLVLVPVWAALAA